MSSTFDSRESANRQLLEDILPLVQTPSHYLGAEVNAIRKDPKGVACKIALAFPDLYEIGMSHLGVQILYRILNSRRDVAADRVFAPRRDLENELRVNNLPLCSLETRTPLSAFHIIGFSLLYELNYTNILNMLDLSGVPLLAKDREPSHPVVIAGGPCAFNPEPLAEVFDAMVVGDGEQVVLDMVDGYLEWKASGEDREGLLRRWSRLPGVYIPSFFEALWDSDGVQTLRPLVRGYETIRKAMISDLNTLPYPSRPVVPFGKPVHDRLAIEVARGCTRGCRFCQAGMIYRPVRERHPEKVLSLVDEGLCSTGYDDVSLLSLSTGDYGSLEPLMTSLMARCEPDRVAVSLPSLRVGSLSERLMQQIKRVRKTGFTLAPEAGTPRLRDCINKNITEEDLQENIEQAFSLGWRLVKLYFMVGLPTETDEDVNAIVDMVGRLRKPRGKGRHRDINVSVSTFVPKAHTPFQWSGQISLEESREKIHRLRSRLKGRGLRFKWQNPDMSILEGLWARGDRRLTPLLVKAFSLGCRFDGWSDQFHFKTWQKAMEETDISLDAYLGERDLEDPLPWDHIDSGVTKAFLMDERRQALQGTTISDCRQGTCHACGVCDFKTIQPVTFDSSALVPVEHPSPTEDAGEIVYKTLRVSYAKTGQGRFFGHLEMVKTIIRAFKRAEIPVRFTQGFHPSPKISFSVALPVGVESKEEYLFVDVPLSVSPDVLMQGVNRELPDGLRLTYCIPSGKSVPKPEVYDYTIQLKGETFSDALLSKYDAALSWPVERKNKKGRVRTIDLKKSIARLVCVNPETLTMRVDLSTGEQVRPKEVLAHVFSLSEKAIRQAAILKEPAK